MNNEELMETLRNFTEKQVNELPDKGKMVFYAIMDIADQRDELKDRINKAKEFIEEHNENAGKLYYKYNNKYLLSELKEDLLNILKGESND